MTHRLVRWWQQLWFAPQDALTLAVCRALYFALLLWNYADQRFAPWANVSRAFWQPIWVFEKFHIPVLPEQALFVLEVVWKGSLAAAALGLLTRVSTMTAFVLAFYLLGLRHNWGKASHDDASTILILGILALSRCGDALSLDALLFRRRCPEGAEGSAAPLPLASGEYRWPIRGVWLILSMVFFNSAVAKLRRSGLEWAWSDNLAVLMVRLNYFNNPTTSWGIWLANVPGFSKFMGVSALAVELFFPLVLFSRIARWIFVPAAILMQIGNKVLLGVDFTGFMLAYVFFVDWRWLLARIGLLRPLAEPTRQSVATPAPRETPISAQPSA